MEKIKVIAGTLIMLSLRLSALGCSGTGIGEDSNSDSDSADIEIVFESAEQIGGTSEASDSSGLILTFDGDPTTLTADDITLSGAAKGALRVLAPREALHYPILRLVMARRYRLRLPTQAGM